MTSTIAEDGSECQNNRQHRRPAGSRVVHKEEDIILRFRDNCTEFNPLDRMKVMDSGDEVSNIAGNERVKNADL